MIQSTSQDAGRREVALISALGREVGIPTLSLDQDGSVGLSFDDDVITLTYDSGSDGFSLFILADRLPGPFGPEGVSGLMALNKQLFHEAQAHVLYNERTLLVAALFRVDLWSLEPNTILPWIDRCRETTGTIRERLWELLGADRQKPADDTDETSFIRV